MSLQSLVQGYVVSALVGKIATATGLPQSTVGSLASKALPLMLGGLATNAKKDDASADSLYTAIRDDHDGSIFDNLEGLIANPQAAKGDKILGHIFGQQTSAIETMLGKSVGVDTAQTKGVMEILAPLVMGALGKQQTDKQQSKAEVLQELSDFSKESATMQDPEQNILMSLLDRDNDGSVLDDVMELGMEFLKNRKA
ncbi:DUF937 domain-containing protein [Candidatus Peribacteria bacterium]|nr:DUF937 domain-containing protein [Candidatus Peribacteria bacterium]